MKSRAATALLCLILFFAATNTLNASEEFPGEEFPSATGYDLDIDPFATDDENYADQADQTDDPMEPEISIQVTAVFIDDPEVGQMTILGQDFDKTSDESPLPVVILGDFPPLDVFPLEMRDEGTRIVAILPAGLVDGDYQLRISVGDEEELNTQYPLTVGAAGQPGPPGRRGDSGQRGQQGVPGRDAFVACTWYGSSNDLFGLGPFPYVNDMLIRHSGEGSRYFRPIDSFTMLPGPDGIEIKQRGAATYYIAIGVMAVDDDEVLVELRLNPGRDNPDSGVVLAHARARGRPAYLYTDTRVLLKQGDVVSALFSSGGGGRLYSRTAGGGSFFQICADFVPKSLVKPKIKKTRASP